MISTDPVQYAKVTQAAAATPKDGYRAEFYGLVCISSTGGSVVVRDGGASGVVVFSKSVATGDVVHFGGKGILCGSGMHVAVGGTAEVAVLYV